MSAKAQPATSATGNSPGSAKAWMEGGFIRQKLTGDQTRETVQDLTHQTEVFVEQLQAAHKPVLILSDYTDVGDTSQESRDELKTVLGTRYFDRIATFGVPPRLQVVGRLLLTLTGKGDQVRIFNTQAEAESWLREFGPKD